MDLRRIKLVCMASHLVWEIIDCPVGPNSVADIKLNTSWYTSLKLSFQELSNDIIFVVNNLESGKPDIRRDIQIITKIERDIFWHRHMNPCKTPGDSYNLFE